MSRRINPQCPLYNHLRIHGHFTDEEIEPILRLFSTRNLRKHQYVLQEGDVSSRDIFVVKGLLRKYSLHDDKEWISQFTTEGQWVTDHASQLTQGPSKYYIDALEDSKILTIRSHDVASLLRENPKFATYYWNELRKTIIVQEKQIRCMQLQAANCYATFVAEFGYLQERVSQSHIASFMGISRESLSRIKSHALKLERNQVDYLERRKVG
ncbi:MAG TPA: Crp/Fnr family transcriptional regulator [Chryseolinea sp.]